MLKITFAILCSLGSVNNPYRKEFGLGREERHLQEDVGILKKMRGIEVVNSLKGRSENPEVTAVKEDVNRTRKVKVKKTTKYPNVVIASFTFIMS